MEADVANDKFEFLMPYFSILASNASSVNEGG